MNLIDGPSIILLLKQKKSYNYYPSYPFSNMWKSWPLFLEIPSVCPFLAHGYCLNLKPLFISLDFYRNVLQNLHFLVFCIQISESFLKLNFIISLSCWKSIKDFSTTYRVQVKYYTKKKLLCDLNHICHFSCISQDSLMGPHAQALFHYVWQPKAWGCITTLFYSLESFHFLKKFLSMISIWTSLNSKIIDDRKYAPVFVSNVFFSVGHIII